MKKNRGDRTEKQDKRKPEGIPGASSDKYPSLSLSPRTPSLSPVFACQRVSLTREKRGYQTTIEIYDAQWQGLIEEEVQRGPYLLWGRPLEEAALKARAAKLLALGKRPNICVFEEGEYQIVATVSPSRPSLAPPEFWPSLLAAGAARDDPASVLSPWQRSARLRFSGAFGRARIEVRAQGELAAIPLEVFCEKLDWEGDLSRLLGDLSEVAASLALRARGSTLLSLERRALSGRIRSDGARKGEQVFPNDEPLFSLASPVGRAPLERLVVLRAILSPRWLPRALARIREFPQKAVRVVPRLVPASAVSRLRPDDLVRALSRQGGAPGRKKGLGAEKLLAESRELSVNTPENRAVLAVLSRVKREASRLSRELSGDPVFAAEAQALTRQAASLRNPFDEDLPGNFWEKPSLFFRRQPGYREVYLAGRLLAHSLSPRAGASSLLEAPGRTMPYLYEVWSFLILGRILAGLFGGRFTPLTTLAEGGVVRLQTGRMQDIAPGVRIGYQMSFAPRARIASYSVPLRPDIYIELAGRRLVFDAKYRLEAEEGTPRHEDLLLVHAYKDALAMDGSFLLYPGQSGPLLYSQSPPAPLPAVGAFPLYPGGSALAGGEAALREFLRACLSSRSTGQSERGWGRRAAERRASYGTRFKGKGLRRRRESQKVSEESQKVPEESQKVPKESQKLTEESQKVPKESQKLTEESQKLSEESQKLSEESQKLTEESQKLSKESQKLPEESQKLPEES